MHAYMKKWNWRLMVSAEVQGNLRCVFAYCYDDSAPVTNHKCTCYRSRQTTFCVTYHWMESTKAPTLCKKNIWPGPLSRPTANPVGERSGCSERPAWLSSCLLSCPNLPASQSGDSGKRPPHCCCPQTRRKSSTNQPCIHTSRRLVTDKNKRKGIQ